MEQARGPRQCPDSVGTRAGRRFVRRVTPVGLCAHTHTHPVLAAPGAAVVPAGVPGRGPRVCGPPATEGGEVAPREGWRLPQDGPVPRRRVGVSVRAPGRLGEARLCLRRCASCAPRVCVPEFQAGVLLPSVTVWGDLRKVARHEPSTGVRGLTKGVPEGAPPTVTTPGEGAGVDRGEDPCGTPRAWTSALRACEESVSAAHQTPGFR